MRWREKPGLALDTQDAFEALDAMKLRPQEFKASHLVWSLPFVQGGMAKDLFFPIGLAFCRGPGTPTNPEQNLVSQRRRPATHRPAEACCAVSSKASRAGRSVDAKLMLPQHSASPNLASRSAKNGSAGASFRTN